MKMIVFSNKNCLYLWNCTVVLLHLELSSVDYDRLCCVISPCPLPVMLKRRPYRLQTADCADRADCADCAD